jgi:hypothetical protein
MKKYIYILFLSVLFYQNNLTAQSPINVIITNICSDVSGSYLFNGLVNGKNNYTLTINDMGYIYVIGVGFDNIKWVLYLDGDLTDYGFSNSAVPSGVLPPFTGWVPFADNCDSTGTMIIEQSLSTIDIEGFNKKTLIFPNPSMSFITIQNKESSSESFEYKIVDFTGRNVKSGNSKFNQKIDIVSLKNGNYIIQIETDKGEMLTEKLIKN